MALSIDGLSKTYRGSNGPIPAVDGLSFEANYGEVLGLLGPNGSGKTTTIKSILGLVNPDAGAVVVDGLEIAKNRRFFLARCGAVLEGSRNLYWRLTPKENINYFAGLRGLSIRAVRTRARSLIDTLGLSGCAGKEVGKLSRGYQQRSAIACALIHNPAIVLLDEPTLGLDYDSRSSVKDLVRSLAREHRAVIVSSHDMAFIEDVCDRVVVLKSGRSIADESVGALRSALSGHTLVITLPSDIARAVSERFVSRPGFRTHEASDAIELLIPLEFAGEAGAMLELIDDHRRSIGDITIRDNDFESAFVSLLTSQ